MPTEETTSRWDADARTYDAWFDRPWGAYDSAVEHDVLIDSAPPLGGLEVCDAGCGTGRFAARLEALYASAHARHRDVVCIAHVTNTMATTGGDFEKGEADGTDRILRLVAAIAALLRPRPSGNVIATGGTL